MNINWFNAYNNHTGRSFLNLVSVTKNAIYFPQHVTQNYKLDTYSVANVGLTDEKQIVVCFRRQEITYATNYTVSKRYSNKCGNCAAIVSCKSFISKNKSSISLDTVTKFIPKLHIKDKDTICIILTR